MEAIVNLSASKKSNILRLNIKDLKERCTKDIEDFKRDQKPNTSIEIVLFDPTDMKYEVIPENINNILKPLNEKLDDKDYVSTVPTLDSEKQKEVWQYRTYLFYQFLIIEAAALRNQTLYDAIYTGESINVRNYMNIDDIDNVLNKVTLGIFGSLTPTSDIDVGFLYLGDPIDSITSYIVSRFESLFNIFTGKSSLRWDIEAYGHISILPNKDKSTKDDYPEYFYLDLSDITQEDYKQLLPFVVAGMMRNILMYSYSIKKDVNIENLNNPTNPINTFYKIFNAQVLSFFDIDKDTIKTGRNLAIQYLASSSDDATRMYYTQLDKAEKFRNCIIRKSNANSNPVFNAKNKIKMLILDAIASIFRQENYVVFSSVLHVVRTIQASNKVTRNSYNANELDAYCDTEGKIRGFESFCTIGKYGYMISILEQLGYLIRFYNTYNTSLENHCDSKIYLKKYNKYKARVDNAFMRLIKIGTERKHDPEFEKQCTFIQKDIYNSLKEKTCPGKTINPVGGKNPTPSRMSNKTKSNRGGARYKTFRRKHKYIPRKNRNNSRKHPLSGIPRRIMQKMSMAKIQKQLANMQGMARGSPPSSPSSSPSASSKLNDRTMRALNRQFQSMRNLGSKYTPISHKKPRKSRKMNVSK